MKTISAEQFKKQFGEDVYNSFGVSQKEKEPGYLSRIGKTIMGEAEAITAQAQKAFATPKNIPEAIQKGFVEIPRTAFRTIGGVAKTATAPLFEAPGIKEATEFIGGKLVEVPMVQKYAEWSQKHPEAAKDIENILDIGAFLGVSKGVQSGLQGIKKTIPKIQGKAEEITSNIASKAKTITQNTPENIMNRVARLNPTDEIKFTKVAGKSPGKYLVDTGNFGNPQDIITRESLKFVQSKNLVDDALSKLPGEYKVTPINTALKEIINKGNKVSSPGARAEYLSSAKQLLQKSKSQGLNMSEINQVKRLFEREIKLGYNKTLNPDLVDKATRIDNVIRKWQLDKARYLGVKNIDAMNKQTQLSKFLIDKLGNKIVGQQALNNITLTDWIMLSGGDPAAVGGFLAKKFFSSKSVQARIAQMLSGNKQGMVTPDITSTPEYLKRPALPMGKPLGEYAIPLKAPTTYEAGVPKSKQFYVKQGIAKVTPKVENSLYQEARKYKSAEEFVNSQTPTYHGSRTPLKKFSNKKGGAFFTDEYTDATGFAGTPDYVYEGYLNFKKPLVIDAKGAKWDKLNTKWGKSTQEIVGNAQKEGYDGVTFKNIVDNIGDTADWGGTSTIHYAMKPESAFINESQLTDIWNKANKTK
jgi:hypothetical protein